ncbi:MAG: leucine-rich repeat domain-containing protein, partial [Ruminococcus sp.]|nr:leucine-rich repeat domain-containing protein [Ruminococcus sp.]
MKKKILSMALALCLTFGTAAALPENIFTSGTGITASALQYGNFTYSLSNGGVTIEKYTGSEENVVIPKTIDGHTVTGIGTDSFYHCKTIKTV